MLIFVLLFLFGIDCFPSIFVISGVAFGWTSILKKIDITFIFLLIGGNLFFIDYLESDGITFSCFLLCQNLLVLLLVIIFECCTRGCSRVCESMIELFGLLWIGNRHLILMTPFPTHIHVFGFILLGFYMFKLILSECLVSHRFQLGQSVIMHIVMIVLYLLSFQQVIELSLHIIILIVDIVIIGIL